jgi:transcriptional regulator with XRE-family HTH domain
MPVILGPMSKNRRIAIKQFMERRGLKPSPWSKASGIRESTLRDYMSGRNNTMTIDTLEKLANAAKVTIAEIIGEAPAEPKRGRDVVAIQGLKVTASMGGVLFPAGMAGDDTRHKAGNAARDQPQRRFDGANSVGW